MFDPRERLAAASALPDFPVSVATGADFYISTPTFENDGAVILGGGTFDDEAPTIIETGNISGFGETNGPVAGAFSITATQSVLTVDEMIIRNFWAPTRYNRSS